MLWIKIEEDISRVLKTKEITDSCPYTPYISEDEKYATHFINIKEIVSALTEGLQGIHGCINGIKCCSYLLSEGKIISQNIKLPNNVKNISFILIEKEEQDIV